MFNNVTDPDMREHYWAYILLGFVLALRDLDFGPITEFE